MQSVTLFAMMEANAINIHRTTTTEGQQITRLFVRMNRTLATQILESSLGNRRLDPAHVATLKKAMLAGQWAPEVADIHIHKGQQNGRLALTGGHHRLTALILAYDEDPLFEGVDMYITISPRSVAVVANNGKQGTLADNLQMHDASKIDGAVLARSATAVMKTLTAQLYRAQGENAIDPVQQINLCNMIAQEIEAADKFVATSCRVRGYAMTLHVLMSLLGERAAAEEYIDGLVRGVGLNEGDPALLVRRLLEKSENKKSKHFDKGVAEQRWAITFLGAYKQMKGQRFSSVTVGQDQTLVTWTRSLWLDILDGTFAPDAEVFWKAYLAACEASRSAPIKRVKRAKSRRRTTALKKPVDFDAGERATAPNKANGQTEGTFHHPV